MKNQRAYLLSLEFGTVQIGDTIFQPWSWTKFSANRKGLKGRPWVLVPEKSMRSARLALEIFNQIVNS